MFIRLRKGWAIAAALVLAIVGLGATPALAEGEHTYAPGDAKLTKVIVAPADTDASEDEYVFHFAGAGTVTEEGDNLVSDGIMQDGATIKKDDVVPAIPDVTLKGVKLTATDYLSNGQVVQAVAQKSILEILQGVTFPHAGIYTYEVTEKSTTTKLTGGIYINPSQAKYKLCIRVGNTNTGNSSAPGNRELEVEGVTVERMKDDNGGDKKTGKVDPTYPKAEGGKITYVSDGKAPDAGKLAGDDRGRFVDGFTFANEYIKGGSFQVKKLYDGAYSDRTKYSLVELTVYSAAAANPDAQGACLTYRIEGDGIDETEYNQDDNGEHRKLNGVRSNISQNNDYMATFSDKGWVTIKAQLKEDSVIRITGEFGPYNADYENDPTNTDRNRRKILSTSGLLQGQEYYVIERYPGYYEPTGYVYEGEGDSVDPRKDESNSVMTETGKLNASITDPTDVPPNEYENNPDLYHPKTIEEGSLVVKGVATGSATTVFVVNTIDENKATPTGIFVDNLPYILMVGAPLIIFAGMFVAKRRESAAA